MQVSRIFLGLGESALGDLLKSVSLGRLRTYQLFDRLKMRAHLGKLNSETLRKAAPRLWARLNEPDEALAADLGQAILVSHLPMIVEVLNYLGIPNDDGFFAKDTEVAGFLNESWQGRVYEEFRSKHPEAVLLFYINHLAAETAKEGDVAPLYTPSAAPSVQ